MTKFWKPLRVIVSLLVLLSTAFIFLDFRQNIDSSWYNGITFLQFVPSFSKFLIVTGIISAGFIIVLLLTLIFGRVYCSFICPLGILQDVISFISKKIKRKKFRFKFAKPKNAFRYSFLALAIAPLLFGSITAVGLLDPYSNFGRIFSGLVQPFYMKANNLLAGALIKMNIYSVFPEDLPHIEWATLIYPAIILALLIILAWRWGRLYCNTVCPVGTFLGLVSRFSLFKIKIDKSSCTKCAKCSFNCKSQCINLKDLSIDFSRCVGCLNCVDSCGNSGISYRLAIPWKKEVRTENSQINKPGNRMIQEEAHSKFSGNNSPVDQSKRQFLFDSMILTGAMLGITGSSAARNRQARTRIRAGNGKVTVTKTNPCSPPGSISLKHFNNTCTACHLCVSACLNNVLRPSLLQYGLQGFLQPYMDTTTAYCNFECTICGDVCPTGAILPLTVEQKKVTQVGIVKFEKHNCVVFTDETVCGACSEHCPTKAVTMVPYMAGNRKRYRGGQHPEDSEADSVQGDLTIPEINADICVGCGACEQACPVSPNRAIYVDGHTVHQIAQKPEITQQDDSSLEEFPF